MSRVSLCIVVALALVSPVFCQDLGPPETVKELNVAKYLGRWFQTHASLFVMETFEKDAVCVTADYGVHNATTLTVYNANRIKTADGVLKDIRGHAFTTDEPGKLSVDLDGGAGRAPYWIIKLGPQSFGDDGLYEYSVVTDPYRVGLFVLTRDVPTFRAKYEQDVLSFLEQNGFDSALNKPIETYQGDDCQHAPTPSQP